MTFTLATDTINSVMSYAIQNIFKFEGQDSEEMAWDAVVAWLTKLRLLEGVPFNYIVPSEEMLPNESIRFFHMDRNWLDAMVDGALSTGILDTRGPFASSDEEVKKEMYQKLMNELNDRELLHNPLRATLTMVDKLKSRDANAFDRVLEKTNANEDTDSESIPKSIEYSSVFTEAKAVFSEYEYSIGGRQSGFLLRSTVVRDYPGLEISAYDAPAFVGTQREQAYTDDYRLETLRQVRLSDSIMLVILNGLPTHLRIKEPGEGICLGVDLPDGVSNSDAWRYCFKIKDVDGNLISTNAGGGGTTYDTQTVRARAGTGDVSVLCLDDILSATPSGWSGHQTPLENGGFLATQLMQFPYEQDFQYNSIHQSSVGSGSAKVNVNSILVEDDLNDNTNGNGASS